MRNLKKKKKTLIRKEIRLVVTRGGEGRGGENWRNVDKRYQLPVIR